MAKVIDLNCDMGESYGRWTLGADETIMPFITSANIACGFHGGDPHVMRKTVALARKHNVACQEPGIFPPFDRCAEVFCSHEGPRRALYQAEEARGVGRGHRAEFFGCDSSLQ